MAAALTVVVVEQPARATGEVLSPSQLRTWMGCGARWMFKYLLGFPEPKNSNLALGAAVHDALGWNFAQKIHSGQDEELGAVLERYVESYAREAEETEFRNDEDAVEIGKQGAGLVECYMVEGAAKIQPAAVEIRVEGEIGGVRVQGRVDILETDGRVTDLKTAQRSPSSIDAAHMLQVATYAKLTGGASGTMRVDTTVRNKTPKLVRHEGRLSPRDFAAVERLYPLAQEMMRGGYYMPNRTSHLCSRRNCPFWRGCEAEYGGVVEPN